ncbi:MAG: hypothetical protein D6705_02985 [Deltaproteobacteria bacterium]|nr:MAG: hypothetical protein D6705_02985 [Deltaproteobacteria bacterium]
MPLDLDRILAALPDRYRPAPDAAGRYYFSIGDHRFTLQLGPDGCTVTPGKPDTPADCVLKTTPELFEKMVLKGKMPGPLDIARGKVKTNDPKKLMDLRKYFDFSGLA